MWNCHRKRKKAKSSDALALLAAAQPVCGVVFVLDGVLMGAGDVRYLAAAGGLNLVPYLPALAVPAHGSGRLAPAGAHGMIALQGPLARGDRISLALRFARAGVVRATATVIAYADVDTATTPR